MGLYCNFQCLFDVTEHLGKKPWTALMVVMHFWWIILLCVWGGVVCAVRACDCWCTLTGACMWRPEQHVRCSVFLLYLIVLRQGLWLTSKLNILTRLSGQPAPEMASPSLNSARVVVTQPSLPSYVGVGIWAQVLMLSRALTFTPWAISKPLDI